MSSILAKSSPSSWLASKRDNTILRFLFRRLIFSDYTFLVTMKIFFLSYNFNSTSFGGGKGALQKETLTFRFVQINLFISDSMINKPKISIPTL